MIRYKMFEKEITLGNHVSYHFCIDKFGNNFKKKSKLKIIENYLSHIDLDLSKYEFNITSSNTTSINDYFHVSYLFKGPGQYVDKDTLRFFNIDVNFPVIYFTRKIPLEDNFKCGFYLNTYKKFRSKFFNKVIKTIRLFKNLYYDIWIAGDFDKNGNFIDNSINIEIIPIQTKENFYLIKDILLSNFDVDKNKINLYDKKFINYNKTKFHFHVKIKYTMDKTIVKFYRTYPDNPYLKYYDN